jgi:thiol-disulfide isomerase/thioredoxin/YHS domain-containing protein
VFAVLAMVAEASAQQGIRWQETSIEGAQRQAAQSGRLVLVHFWSPSCGPCRKMDRDVFARPEVAAAVAANYVPVKINADHFPHTCQQYRITALPTDLILSPDGQPLSRSQGFVGSDIYVGRLDQVAAAASSQAPPAYAARPPVTPPARQPDVAVQPRVPTGAGMEARPDMVASSSGRPEYAPPRWGNRPPLDYRHDSPPEQPPVTAQAAPPYANPPMDRPAWGAPPFASSQAPATPKQAPPVAQQPPASSPPVAATQPRATTPQIPPGNPPLALEGYCPVELCERQRWVLGNTNWGAIHRGRTYLFAGPEERRRFMANPDHYAPALSGDDVVLSLDHGRRVPGFRQHGVFFRNRVYLFASEQSLSVFAQGPDRYADRVAETTQTGGRTSFR